MLKQHTSESSLNWHGLTWIGGTFESDTGGTFHSDMPGTFQSAADGTFVSAIDGTFQSDMSGTFGPMLSADDKGLSAEERMEQRRKISYPTILMFEKWIEETYAKVLPKSRLGEALAYATVFFPVCLAT